MQEGLDFRAERSAGFFLALMAYSNLAVHMKTNMSFKILPEMSWSIQEVESLSPFEREAYLILSKQYIEKLMEKRQR